MRCCCVLFFFSSRRRHTRCSRDWSSDVCSSDLAAYLGTYLPGPGGGKAAVSLADALRLYDRPITRVENYCATGTDAFRNGCLAVAAGAHDVVLVLGAGNLKDRGGPARPPPGHPPPPPGNTA